MLRHQQLKKGAHDEFYRVSREGVWPWAQRMGTRAVGQWLVVYPTGGGSPGFDDGYRLVRYASFDHWRATRETENSNLGGNGPNRERNLAAQLDRGGVLTGSKGAYFLQGENAPTRPLYMPGLSEKYELIERGRRPAAQDEVIAVRNDVAQPGQEIVELRYQRVSKGMFDQFVAYTRDAIWPWEEKLGARPIGQWKVIYPDAPNRTQESPEFDEVVTMTRYASYAHWQAMRPGEAVFMGGNGPDWRAWRSALDEQARLERDGSVEFMQGEMYYSPPIFMPGLPERYRLTR